MFTYNTVATVSQYKQIYYKCNIYLEGQIYITVAVVFCARFLTVSFVTYYIAGLSRSAQASAMGFLPQH